MKLQKLLKDEGVEDQLDVIGSVRTFPSPTPSSEQEIPLDLEDFGAIQRAAAAAGESRRLEQIETVLFPSGARNAAQLIDVAAAYVASYFRAVLLVHGGSGSRQPSILLEKTKDLRACDVEVLGVEDAIEHVKRVLWAARSANRFKKLLAQVKKKE